MTSSAGQAWVWLCCREDLTWPRAACERLTSEASGRPLSLPSLKWAAESERVVWGWGGLTAPRLSLIVPGLLSRDRFARTGPLTLPRPAVTAATFLPAGPTWASWVGSPSLSRRLTQRSTPCLIWIPRTCSLIQKPQETEECAPCEWAALLSS